jgi:hypothetical protein
VKSLTITKTYSAFLTRLWVLTTLSVPCVSSAETVSPVVDYQTANTLLVAASKIQLSQKKLLANLQLCGETFAHLAEGANKARTQWMGRNHVVLDKATQVSTFITANLRDVASPFTAEKMAMEMSALVEQDTRAFVEQFKSRTRKHQHYLCNRLILSIPDGEQDLDKENPAETRALLDFQL